MRECLLLNASYEPLKVIALKRAVVLVLQEKAEIVEAAEEPVRSASFEMQRPTVIRLNYFVRIPYKARVALNRRSLAARDHGECQVTGCTRKGDSIDHVVPRARGGKHEWLNVSLMCSKHNHTKSDRLLSELGWTLKNEPTVPRASIIVGIVRMDPTWAPHLGTVLGVA